MIGKPDPVAGESSRRSSCCGPGYDADDALRRELHRVRPVAARGRGRAAGDRVRERPSRRHAAARSCAGCSRARELGLPEGDISTLEGRTHDGLDRLDAPHHARAAPRDAAHPPLRGALRRAVQRGEDPRLPAPLHRRGSGRGRASCRRSTPDDAVVATYREHGHALARGVPATCDHGGDVRQGRGLQPRARRLDAPLRRRQRASTAATPSSAAGCRSPSGWRSPTSCRAGDG